MSLRPVGFIDLPEHRGEGGFDHAAVHTASATVFVAHTANDAVDVIDGRGMRYLRSIPGLKGVAGAPVSDERDLVFAANRGEDTVSIIPAGRESDAVKVKVGRHPNGLAFDPTRGLLLAANVGDPQVPNSYSVSVVDVTARQTTADTRVPGRTRWTVYDQAEDAFYVNVRDPPQIAVVHARQASKVSRWIPVPAAGPHGLELDSAGRRLFCACDAARLVVIDLPSGRLADERGLSGAPDVIVFNPGRRHLYVAVGDPGVIDVFDTSSLERIESYRTEKGAHTIAFDAAGNRVYAFLPETHRAAVYEDAGGPRG